MKKINMPSLVFALALLIIGILKWSALNTVGILIFSLAVLGFAIIGIAPLFTNKK